MGVISIYKASAGSGKTYRLTHLISDAVQGNIEELEAISPERIIATTFTKKAAEEIKTRAQEVVLGENEGLGGTVENKVSNALRFNDSLIGTVNGICNELIAKYSLFIGQASELRVIEEDERDLLFKELISQYLEANILRKAAYVGMKNQQENRIDLDKQLLYFINTIRSNHIDINTLSGKDLLDDLRSESIDLSSHKDFAQEVGGTIDSIDVQTIDVSDAQKSKLLDVKIAFKDYKINPCAFSLKNFFRKLKGVAKKTFERLFNDDLKQKTQEFYDEIHVSKELNKEIVEFFDSFIRIAQKVMLDYEQRKQEMGLIDFTDQEVLLLEAVQDNDVVREDIKASYDLLFVDEFQDTNPIQLAIFNQISGLVKKTFWIGDAKQAIYGFRGSDDTLTANAITTVQNSPRFSASDKAEFKYSYRTRQELLDFTKGLFQKSLQTDVYGTVELKTPGNRVSPKRHSIEVWLENLKPLARKPTKVSLAGQIYNILQSPKDYLVQPKIENELRAISPSDICVLCMTNSEVEATAKALKDLGLEVNAPLGGFMEQFEVQWLLNVLKWINYDKDYTAQMIAFLPFHTKGHVDDAINKQLQYIESDEYPHSDEWKRFIELKQDVKFLDFQTQVKSVIQLTNIYKRIKGSSNESKVYNNLQRFEELVDTFIQHCNKSGIVSDIFSFESFLQKQDPTQGFESHPNAVNVMTYHKSKGLEWPMVILTDLQKSISVRDGFKLFSSEDFDLDNPLKGRTIKYYINGFESRDEALSIHLNEKARNENARLMYVGVTRAKDYLVLFAGENQKKAVSIKLLEEASLKTLTGENIVDLPEGEGKLEIGNATIPVIKKYIHEITVEKSQEQPFMVDRVDVNYEGYKFNKAHLTGSGKESITNTKDTITLSKKQVSFDVSIQYEKVQSIPENHFGDIVHEIMYLIADNKSDKIATYLNYNQIDVITPSETKTFINAYQKLLKHIESKHGPVKQVFPEQPFRYKNNIGQELSGVIDLLVETEQGILIIDYKSHYYKKTDLLKYSEEHYIIQMQNYKAAVEASGRIVFGVELVYLFNDCVIGG